MAVKNLKDIVNKNKPSFIFLMETRKKTRNKMEFLRKRRFKYNNAFYVDLVGQSGGVGSIVVR